MSLAQTEPKKIYIWISQSQRTPWANTIIYYPLNSISTTSNLGTLWSTYDLTNSWVTFSSDWWYFNGSSWLSAVQQNLPDATQYTLAFWCKPTWSSWRNIVIFDWDNTSWHDFWVTCNLSEWIELWTKGSWMSYFKPTGWDGSWHCVVYTIDSTAIKLYVDNILVNTATWGDANVWYHYRLQIWHFNDSGSTSLWPYNWYLSDIVLDTSIWDTNTISNYYSSIVKS